MLVGLDNVSDDSVELEEVEVKKVGLSSRGEMHCRKKCECIREFHKLLDKMPQRYSYGKMVQGVRVMTSCQKRGKIISCDHEEWYQVGTDLQITL